MKALSNLYSIRMGIIGIVVLLVGLWFFSLILENLLVDLPIWILGETVPAQVDETWAEQTGETNAGELTFSYFVRYSFTTPMGEQVSGSSGMAAEEWTGFGEGSEILVTYLPSNPSQNRVNDTRFIPLLACSYMPLIFIGLVVLLSGWGLLSRGFKKMETAPWVTG